MFSGKPWRTETTGKPTVPIKAQIKKPGKKPGSKVNRAWIDQHINDSYVQRARKDGYRARAAYKLEQIDAQTGLVRPGQTVVDLGAAPGAWSQYLRRRMARTGAGGGALDGCIVALDVLPMQPIDGVRCLHGDFRAPEVLAQLEQALAGRAVDLVLSDMAPNLSGIAASDAARSAELVELALAFALRHLRPDGALLVKLFHGSAHSGLLALFKQGFERVLPIKPQASRAQSAETFLLGRGIKKTGTGR